MRTNTRNNHTNNRGYSYCVSPKIERTQQGYCWNELWHGMSLYSDCYFYQICIIYVYICLIIYAYTSSEQSLFEICSRANDKSNGSNQTERRHRRHSRCTWLFTRMKGLHKRAYGMSSLLFALAPALSHPLTHWIMHNNDNNCRNINDVYIFAFIKISLQR